MLLDIMLVALSEDDRDFVSGIFEEYGKQMYSIALDILKNEHDADDALQETMYKIIKLFLSIPYQIRHSSTSIEATHRMGVETSYDIISLRQQICKVSPSRDLSS